MQPIMKLFFGVSLIVLAILQERQALAVRLTRTTSQCVTKDEVERLIQAEREVLVRQLDHHVGSFHHPVQSCKNLPADYLTGYYWIRNSTGNVTLVYCDMVKRCDCGGNTRGWARVAHLDMTDPDHQCPTGLQLKASPKRTCEKFHSSAGCASVVYPTHGQEYSRVCGRISAYQESHPAAFRPYRQRNFLTLNDSYIDGISLTYGMGPRQHIWTFAAAYSDKSLDCSCSAQQGQSTRMVPPFVGRDYFCETGSRTGNEIDEFFGGDPLWDGEGCSAQADCCGYNNPPWFCKRLSQPSTEDIEVRLCLSQHVVYGNVAIEKIDIYIQ